jgi:hypothetical protein
MNHQYSLRKRAIVTDLPPNPNDSDIENESDAEYDEDLFSSGSSEEVEEEPE